MEEFSVGKPKYLFKIVALGSGGVGKTSLIRSYAGLKLEPVYLPTLGIDITSQSVTVDGTEVRLLCSDTAGQEYFSRLRPAYYKGACGALIVFDITQIRTFEAVGRWLEELSDSIPDDIPKILIGNKIDLENREVAKEQAEKFAKKEEMLFYETSALTGANVKKIFKELTRLILIDQEEKEKQAEKK
ncbi:MAG: Rab family GTPase [Promethearchaeota archaeon]